MQMFSIIKNKLMRFANSRMLKLLLLFLFVFVITSLVEVITNFYEVKTPIVHGYFMWIMLFLFMCVILPPNSSQLTIPKEGEGEGQEQEEAKRQRQEEAKRQGQEEAKRQRQEQEEEDEQEEEEEEEDEQEEAKRQRQEQVMRQSGGGGTEEASVVSNLGFLSPILNF